MAAPRIRLEEDPENALAPCHSMILTPEEVRSRFVVYTQTLEKFLRMNTDMDIRSVAKRWPRKPTSMMYVQELKITKRESLENDGFIKIKVVSTNGPKSFSFQVCKMSDEFKFMEDQIKVFYDDPDSNYKNPKYVVATGVFDGSYYAVFSHRRRQWVRCLCHTDIPVVKPESVAVVTLVDYGCNETVKGNYLRPLIPSFCRLPLQGYTAVLTDWHASNSNNRVVSPLLRREFRDKVVGKTLLGKVSLVNRVNPVGDQTIPQTDCVMSLFTLEKKRITFRNEDNGEQVMVFEDENENIHPLVTDH